MFCCPEECIMYSVHCKSWAVHYTMYLIHSALLFVHCILCAQVYIFTVHEINEKSHFNGQTNTILVGHIRVNCSFIVSCATSINAWDTIKSVRLIPWGVITSTVVHKCICSFSAKSVHQVINFKACLIRRCCVMFYRAKKNNSIYCMK